MTGWINQKFLIVKLSLEKVGMWKTNQQLVIFTRNREKFGTVALSAISKE